VRYIGLLKKNHYLAFIHNLLFITSSYVTYTKPIRAIAVARPSFNKLHSFH